jgi:hypothetical protein
MDLLMDLRWTRPGHASHGTRVVWCQRDSMTDLSGSNQISGKPV